MQSGCEVRHACMISERRHLIRWLALYENRNVSKWQPAASSGANSSSRYLNECFLQCRICNSPVPAEYEFKISELGYDTPKGCLTVQYEGRLEKQASLNMFSVLEVKFPFESARDTRFSNMAYLIASCCLLLVISPNTVASVSCQAGTNQIK